MTTRPGTIVASAITTGITPDPSLNTFATHYADEGKGGLRTVSTITDRNNITTDRREMGMLCYVLDSGDGTAKMYQLVSGTTNACWTTYTSGGVSTSNEIVINVTDDEIAGKQYQDFDNAFVYAKAQTPSATKTFATKFSGVYSGTTIIPQYVSVVGDDPSTSILSGNTSFESLGGQYFATNNISNCTISNLIINGPPIAITYTITTPTPYAQMELAYSLSTDYMPTYGTHSVTIGTDTTNPIVYNAYDLLVENAIKAMGVKYSQITVSGNYAGYFLIEMYGFAAVNASQIFDITNIDMNPGLPITHFIYQGTTEVQRIAFSSMPTQGSFQLTFVYDTVTYTSTALQYNSTDTDVRNAIKAMFTAILVATGTDLGINFVGVSQSGGGSSLIFDITLTGYPGESPQFDIKASTYSLMSYSPQNIGLDNVKLIGATCQGNNGAVIKNSLLSCGDLSSFTSYFVLLNSYALAYSTTDPVVFPVNSTISCCDIFPLDTGTIKFNSAMCASVNIDGINNITFNPGSYTFLNSRLHGDFTIPTSVTMTLSSTYVDGTITVAFGGTLLTDGTYLTNVPTVQSGGTWTNKGDVYDNRTSGLIATGEQAAIDEIWNQGSPKFSNITVAGIISGTSLSLGGNATISGTIFGAEKLITVSSPLVRTFNNLTIDQSALTLDSVGGTLSISKGGTGQISKTNAFDALSPITSQGDIIVGGTAGTNERLQAGTATTVLHSGPNPAWLPVVEADITLSANSTNNVSVSKHGFAPILPGNASLFFDGAGNYSTPVAGVANAYSLTNFSGQTSINVVHNFGTYPNVQVLGEGNQVIIPSAIVNNTLNDFTVTFLSPTSGYIIASVGSPQPQAVRVVTNDYVIQNTDRIVQQTSSGKVLSLLTAVGNAGREFLIDNASSGNIIVSGTETIQGEISQTIPLSSSMWIYADGTKWRFS